MSTITTINASDVVANSRATINTNFTNLNTDKVEGQSSSVDSEIALFSGTGGKTIKRATSTGILKGTSGVISAITPGSGVETFLTTPSSANLATAVTDETGSGALVFGTNPTIAKPVMNATNPTAQTYSPSASGTATLDLSLSNQHYITMPAGNITVALSNDTNNQVFVVSILQDATGSRTVTWFSTIRWAGGSAPTLTTTASKRDVFGFIRTGSGTYDGFVIGKNI